MEPSSFVSAEWPKTIKAASNRPWTNAAKVITSIAAERPELGAAVAARAATMGVIDVRQRELVAMVHVDGRSELDRLAAMGVLPRPK